MRDFATTPSIDITIGRQTRLYHAFVTTAPVALDSPSTVTLYTSTLVDLAGFNPPGKLADAELHFTSGPLDGGEADEHRVGRCEDEVRLRCPA